MVKTATPISQAERIDVEFMRGKQNSRHKPKGAALDDDDGDYSEYDGVAPVWEGDTSNCTDTSISTTFRQERTTANHNKVSLDSISYSKSSDVKDRSMISIDKKKRMDRYRSGADQRQERNLTYKHLLLFLLIFFLGCLAIVALILPNVLLYLMLPTLFQSSMNRSSLTQPVVYANHCGGISSYDRWMPYVTTGIYMPINTSSCNFNITPLYYTSIIGDSLQDYLTGVAAIYSSSRSSFAIYCRPYGNLSTVQILNYSQTQKWDVQWVGIYY